MSDNYLKQTYEQQNRIDTLISDIESGRVNTGFIEDINFTISVLGGNKSFTLDECGTPGLLISYMSALMAKKIIELENAK